MTKKDWAPDFFLLVLGVAFTFGSLSLSFGSLHQPGPGFLPFYTGAGLSLIALLSLIQSLLRDRSEKTSRSEKTFDPSLLKVTVIVVSMAAYSLILPWSGYFLSTFLLLTLLLKVGGFQRWLHILATAAVTAYLSYVLFGSWLNMRFPRGILGF